MSTVALDQFLPYVLPFARGASELAATAEIRRAAIDFCQRTKVWREFLDPLAITAGNADVDLFVPADAELYEIAEVWYHDNPLDPAAEDQLRAKGIAPTDTGTPEYYTHVDDIFTLRLAPIPRISEAAALRVRAVLHPARDADTVPDALWRRYATEVAQGALERLHGYDDKWADRVKRGEYANLYKVSVASVAHLVAKSNVRARRRVRPSYF